MGAIPSNPLNEERMQRITQITTDVCTTFTKEYILGYKSALIQKIKDDMNAEPAPERRLKSRPPRTDPLLETPAKRRDGMKPTDTKWQDRYLCLNADKTLDYRASKTGKLKNHMSLVGYWVYRESEEGHPWCFSLKHWRKRTYVFEVESEEVRDKWVNLLWYACWYNNQVENENACAGEAFKTAYSETRGALGYYRCEPNGTEEEALGDLAFREVDREVLSAVYSEIGSQFSGNTYWKVKGMVDTAADNAIMGVVRPAWAAVQKQVNELHPILEEKMKSAIGPLLEAQNNLKAKVSEAVQPVLGAAVGKVLTPVVSKIAPAVYNRLSGAYKTVEEQFESLAQEAAAEGNWQEAKKQMDAAVDYYWARALWPCVRALWPLEEDLRLVADLLPGIEYWGLIKSLEAQVTQLLQDAVYTFQDDVDANLDKPAALARTKEALQADIAAIRGEFLTDSLLSIVLSPFESEAVPVCVQPVQPLADAIPEAFKELLDPVQLITDILVEQVTNAVTAAIEAALPSS